MKRGYILCFILLQLSAIAFGQKSYEPGYIIKNNSDTIRGMIKITNNYLNSKSCDFFDSDNQYSKTYFPGDIKGYRIKSKRLYVSREVEIDSVKQMVFLEYLVHGIVDLYYLKEASNEYFFIDKGGVMTRLNNDGKNVTVTENENTRFETIKTYYKPSFQYKRMLNLLFQESPATLKKVEGAEYSYRSLIDLTVDYHNNVCKDGKCIDYTKSGEQGVFIEPFLGFINSCMGFKTSKDYAPDMKPFFGFGLRFKPFKGYSLWDFVTGLNYSTNNFTGKFKTSIFDAPSGDRITRTDSVKVKYSIVRLPLMAEYTFPTKKIKPFFSMGLTNGFIFKPDFNYINTGSYAKNLFRRYNLSALAGFGLKMQLSEKGFFYIKDEIEYRRPVAVFGYYYEYQHVISNLVSFGYGIKLK